MTELEAYGSEIDCPGLTLTELISAHRFFRASLAEYGKALGIHELSLGGLMDLYTATKHSHEQTRTLLLDTLIDLKYFQGVLRLLLEGNTLKSSAIDMVKEGLLRFSVSEMPEPTKKEG